MKKAFDRASGGVLFIDEAYALSDGYRGYYGDEAISTIVQEMENRREDVTVVFAGYSDPMEDFLSSNPGLRSRIAKIVQFADYTNTDLLAIARFMAGKEKLKLADGVEARMAALIDTARGSDSFGNGRFVRTVIEEARLHHARRLREKGFASCTDEELTTLMAEDFAKVKVEACTAARTIGFHSAPSQPVSAQSWLGTRKPA